MTPLEKAVEAGNALEMSPDGYWLVSFEPAQVSAIIRAFLEAAAEDAQIVRAADIAFWQAIDGREPPALRRGAPAKAAILALKETING